MTSSHRLESPDSDKLILVTNMIRAQTTKQIALIKKFLFNFETPFIRSISHDIIQDYDENISGPSFINELKLFNLFSGHPDIGLSIFSKFSVHQSRQDTGENYNFVTSEAKRNFLRSQPSVSPSRSGHAITTGGELHLSLPGRRKKFLMIKIIKRDDHLTVD